MAPVEEKIHILDLGGNLHRKENRPIKIRSKSGADGRSVITGVGLVTSFHKTIQVSGMRISPF